MCRHLLVTGVVMMFLATGNPAAAADAKAQVVQICRTSYEDDPRGSEKLLEAMSALGPDGREALLKLGSGKSPESVCALYYLAIFQERRALPIFRRVLDAPKSSRASRDRALLGIQQLQDGKSFERVLRIFRATDDRLTEAAARALGAIGDPRALGVLRDALVAPRYKTVKPAIVGALGVEGHTQAIDLLVEVLREDPSYGDLVAKSLALIGTARSRSLAVEAVSGIQDEYARREGTLAVSQILWRQKQASRDPREHEEIDRLRWRLQEYQPWAKPPS
jgi:HEAT repeats